MKLTFREIDWKNQIVAFIGTILGVIIALQLEDIQDERQSQQRLNKTVINLDSEISKNLISIDSASKSNENWSKYLNFLIGKKVDNREIILSNHELDSIQRLLPFYFTPNKQILNLNVKKVINDSLKLYSLAFFNSFQKPDISEDNWEATKESGVLLIMNPDQILFYTKIYKQFESLNDPNVLKYYWTVRNINSRKLDNLIEANPDVNSYQIELWYCSDTIHSLLNDNKN